MGARAPLVSVREYRLRPYQVTFREFGDRTTSRGCARRQSTYTERVDRRGSRPGARGQHMGGGGWSRADPMAHKRTRARFFRSGRRRRAHPPPPHVRGAPRSTRTSTRRLTLTHLNTVQHRGEGARARERVRGRRLVQLLVRLHLQPGITTTIAGVGHHPCTTALRICEGAPPASS